MAMRVTSFSRSNGPDQVVHAPSISMPTFNWSLNSSGARSISPTPDASAPRASTFSFSTRFCSKTRLPSNDLRPGSCPPSGLALVGRLKVFRSSRGPAPRAAPRGDGRRLNKKQVAGLIRDELQRTLGIKKRGHEEPVSLVSQSDLLVSILDHSLRPSPWSKNAYYGLRPLHAAPTGLAVRGTARVRGAAGLRRVCTRCHRAFLSASSPCSFKPEMDNTSTL